MSVSTVPARLPEPPPADIQSSAEGRVVARARSASPAAVALASVLRIALALLAPHAVAILLSAIGYAGLFALRLSGARRGWLPTRGVPIRRPMRLRMSAPAHPRRGTVFPPRALV